MKQNFNQKTQQWFGNHFTKVTLMLLLITGMAVGKAAATTLAAGDLAFVAVNPSGTDKFSVVVLRAGGFAAGTVINFTDNGFLTDTTGRTGEGFLTYTAPAAVSAGTVLTWTNGMTITGTGWSSNNPSNFALNATGEQLFAFQGTTANWATQSGITLITGINFGAALSSTSSANNTVAPRIDKLPNTGSFSNFFNFPTGSQANAYLTKYGAATGAVVMKLSETMLRTNLASTLNWVTSSSSQNIPNYAFTLTAASNTVNVKIKNITQTSGTELTFQVFARFTGDNDSITLFTAFQGGVNFNYAALANGGSISGSWDSVGRDPSIVYSAGLNGNVNSTSNQIRMFGNHINVNSATKFNNSPDGKCLGTFTLTNSVPFTVGVTPTFTWDFNTGSGTTTQSLIQAYLYGRTIENTIAFTDAANDIPDNTPNFTVDAASPIISYSTGPTDATLSGDATICAGASPNLIVDITDGTGPFDVVLNDGTNDTTINGYNTGDPIPVSPSTNVTYTLVSVTDANSAVATNPTGTATITVNQPTTSASTAAACSSYIWANNGATYTASGTYTYTSLNGNGCLNTDTLHLLINNTTSSLTATACDFYIWAANGVTYTASGVYTSTSLNANSCVNTATLNLTINNSTSSSASATACNSYTWAANGLTYTTSGTYTSTSLNAFGCVNTAALNLTINNNTTSSESASTCDLYVWHGTTYTASGSYTYTSLNASGCVNTATLTLTITPSTSNTTTTSACDTYTWSVNGTTYTTSGTYSNVTGCHTEILNLTINSSTSSSTSITACDSYTWATNNVTYTTSGTYSASTGCATATLVLTINSSSTSSELATACDSYVWHGTTYTASGSYTYTSLNASNCVNTATLTLTINHSSTSSVSATACDSYTWAANGVTYTATGAYTSTSFNASGCVNTATLNLTINNSTTSSVSATACDSYTWAANGFTYTATGVYTSTSLNASGCVNTATLNLTINNSTTSSVSATVCDSYTWAANGVTYTATGAYTATSFNASGCVNTATLNLTINHSSTSSVSATACNSYTWAANGVTYTTSGTYTNTSVNASNCVNTATLNLIINNSTSSTTTISATNIYTWSVNGATYTNSGTYTSTSLNAAGCVHTSTLVLTINVGAFYVNVLLDQPISCYGSNNGSIATVVTPSGSYTYTLDGGLATNNDGSFSNLAPGVHTVSVTDGFSTISGTITITQPDSLQANILIDSTVSCLSNDGSLYVDISGGTNIDQPYLTWWTNANGDTLNDVLTNNFATAIQDLTAGTYNIMVEDDHYCFATASIILGSTPSLVVTSSHPAINCYGGTTLITPASTGGTGTVTFAITGGAFTVGTGTYVITATDAKGCTATTSITISQPTVVIASSNVGSNYNGAQLSCALSTDGIINASGVGGTGAYTFAMDGGTYQASNQFINQSAGAHTISVKDANGCVATSTSTITPPPAMGANAIVSSNYNGVHLSCASSTDGKITASGNGGTGGIGNYSYKINGGSYQGSPIFSSLAAGTYTVTVKDINGCTATATATIVAPMAIASLAYVTSNYNGSQLSCPSNSDGKITATGTGGTGIYSYSKSGTTFQTSPVFSGLGAGTYTITTKDANGCSATTTITIIAQPGIVASASVTSSYNGANISCHTSMDGTITASATGGTGSSYQYKINAGTFQTSPVFSGLGAGVYTITAKDVNGCTSTVTKTIIAPSSVVASASVTSNYGGSQLSCNLASDGQITASGSGGTAPYQYKVDFGSYQSSPFFINLAAGTHTITAKDTNGCFATTTLTIVAPSPIFAGAIVGTSYNGAQLSCHASTDGIITAIATGGTGSSYQFKIDGGGYQTSATFNNLSAGTHTVTVKDVNGCSASATAVIVAPVANAISAIVTSNYLGAQISCTSASDGIVVVSSTGGTGSKTYSINGTTFQSSTTFNGLAAGNYTVTVKDVNNCTATNTITITPPPAISAGAYVSSSYNTAQISCHLSTDGIVTASGAGGTGSYTYSIDGGSYQASTIFGNLNAYVHTVATKDANGCIATATVTIAAPSVITPTATVISSYNGAQISCPSSTDGEIFVSAVGGTGTYTYKINSGSYQSSQYFNGLGAGNYTITTRDANGCTSSATATITAPTQIVASSVVTTPVTCSGGTGTVTVSAIGGTGSYTGTGVFTVTVGGPFVFNVADVNGCSTTTSITISQPALVTGSSSLNACNSYTWNGQVFNGSGAYTHTYTTASGCDSVHTLNLTILSSTSSTTNLSSYITYTWAPNGVTYTATGVYTATISNAAGCDSNMTLNLTILPGVVVAAKLILGGAYDAASGLMYDSLRVNDLIPFTEPYSSAPFSKPQIGGSGGETVSSSILSVTGNDAIVDWVFVELRSASNFNGIVATKRALLQRDGDVVSAEDGVSPLLFKGFAGNNYYVSIKHRNHLGVMTSTALPLTINATNIDFSDPSYVVYINPTVTANSPRKIVGSKAVLWPGDANYNKNVKYNGLTNDKDPILAVVGSPNNTLYGYRPEDVNMDGKIRYNNTDNDKNFISLQLGTNVNLILGQHTPN